MVSPTLCQHLPETDGTFFPVFSFCQEYPQFKWSSSLFELGFKDMWEMRRKGIDLDP